MIANVEEEPKVTGCRKTASKVALVTAVLLAAAGAAGYYLHQRAYESTDNAFIEGNIVQVSPRVSGQVLRVHVTDNQRVSRGDLIAEIDPKDFILRLEEARARLRDTRSRAAGATSAVALTTTVTGAVLRQAAAALDAAREQVKVLEARRGQDEAAIRAAEAAVRAAEAHQTAARAEAERATADAKRYAALYERDEVSRQQLERAQTAARAASANFEAAGHAVSAARAQLEQAAAGRLLTLASLRQAERMVHQAEGRLQEAGSGPQQVAVRRSEADATREMIAQQEAAVSQAELALSYTRIVAPETGYVTRKSVEPGNVVQAGQPLLALVAERVWVVANFKETQLTHMRAGQPATLRVDAYPQLRLRGKVESIQSGTGARFSLLPPENATGNYVKVVQRVPVKIVLDEPPPPGYRLGPGMSVEPKVKVR